MSNFTSRSSHASLRRLLALSVCTNGQLSWLSSGVRWLVQCSSDQECRAPCTETDTSCSRVPECLRLAAKHHHIRILKACHVTVGSWLAQQCFRRRVPAWRVHRRATRTRAHLASQVAACMLHVPRTVRVEAYDIALRRVSGLQFLHCKTTGLCCVLCGNVLCAVQAPGIQTRTCSPTLCGLAMGLPPRLAAELCGVSEGGWAMRARVSLLHPCLRDRNKKCVAGVSGIHCVGYACPWWGGGFREDVVALVRWGGGVK